MKKKNLSSKLSQKIFFQSLINEGIKPPETEYQFHPKRKWRFDYCFVEDKIAIEVEGGVWIQGRHTRGKGFIGDMEKYNTAVLHGYRLIRILPEELTSKKIIKAIKILKKIETI